MNIADLMIHIKGNIEREDLISASIIQTDEDLSHWKTAISKNLRKADDDFYNTCKKYHLNPEKIFFSEKGVSAYYYVDVPIVFELYDFFDSSFLTQALTNKHSVMQKQMNKFIHENNYIMLLFCTPEPFQKMVFHEIYEQIPIPHRYEAFIDFYTDCEYGFKDFENRIVEDAISHQNPDRKKKALNDLHDRFEEDKILIYRGIESKSLSPFQSMSWTTNLSTAIFFATRYTLDGIVYCGEIHKTDVIDYIHNRNEFEILTNPKNILDIKKLRLHNANDEMEKLEDNGIIDEFHHYVFLLERLQKKFRLFESPRGIHGISHTKRVLLHALNLAFELDLDEYDTKILATISNYHDIGRTNDDEDPYHGQESVKKISLFNLYGDDFDNDEIEIMNAIIEVHCISDEEGYERINQLPELLQERATTLFTVFKDADGLDRVRLRDLDSNYLRHNVSKERILFAEHLFKGLK